MSAAFGSATVGSAILPCPDNSQSPAHKVTTWIRVILLGDDDKPIPEKFYRIVLPNGDIASGYLNENGSGTVENIEPGGTCKVQFPELDAEAWAAAGSKDFSTGSIVSRLAQPDKVVGNGDCLASVGPEVGFFWETIWNHPGNRQLKALRKDPFTLCTGDVVVIPELRIKEESRATGQEHRFHLRGVPVVLRIKIVDHRGKALPNLDYVLEVDQVPLEGTTGRDGRLQEWIAPNAREARLKFTAPETGAEEILLDLGSLDPLHEVAGIQGRLANLGFYDGPADGGLTGETLQALACFQDAFGLDVTGQLDARTRAALAQVAEA